MATKLAHKRLTKEYQAMQKAPPPFIYARFDEKNILDWHFIIAGPPDSPYAGGQYHGIILFPSEYPFKPPDIKFYTPSGRFAPGEKICFSMTSFHPSTWNAAWSVATILTGALSFMLGNEITTGSIRTSDADKKRLAKESHAFNIANKKFRDIFPEYAGPVMKDLPDMGLPPSESSAKAASDDSSTPVNTSALPDSPASPSTESSTSTTGATGDKVVVQVQALPLPMPTNGQIAGTIQRKGWFSQWRWILAALAVIILGRISSS